jgi:hypothetical protein
VPRTLLATIALAILPLLPLAGQATAQPLVPV